MPDPAHVYRARWLIAADGSAIEDAALVTAGGRIVRVGPWTRMAALVGPADAVEHFPDAAILPGLVNAHTHLGLTDMAGRFRPTANFPAWIGRLAARLFLRGKAAARDATRRGAEESAAAGTVAGADMTPTPDTGEILPADAGRWTVFGEVFGHGDAGIDRLRKVAAAAEHLARTRGTRVGLAPHAPYTAGISTYAAARREADARGWPLSTHLHETLDEIAFTERGEGTLHAWLRRLGMLPAEWRPPGLRPIRALAEAGFFPGPVLVAHGNYLDDKDIAILARSGSSVAFCPRSHAFFKHKDHPWRRLLAAGVNVCLGTDSLASSPSLSVLDEARYIYAREGGADPRVLLAMATRNGARALGLEGEIGNLCEGLAAAACVMAPLPRTDDPLGTIMAGAGRVLRSTALL